ncbi:hypothetical protein C0995_012965 [Termitomyces sp. Mi166|nr:hypothetical protein C0995_012965 [Termitomyces sp. Mi166\
MNYLDMIMNECTNYANSNPDISGVGVRISFYLQTFLLVLLVDRSWQSAPIALWTFIATSAGLILAAIIIREELTLFQALQVSNLVWLANFGIFFALASYSRQKAASRKEKDFQSAHDFKVKFGAMAQSLMSMALTLYMWYVYTLEVSSSLSHMHERGNAKTFGPLSECSHLVKYIFFVIEAQATSVGRIVGLVITSLLTAIYLLITLQELNSYRQSYSDHPKRSSPSQSPSSLPFPLPLGNSAPVISSNSVHLPTLSVANGTSGSAPRPHRNTISSNPARSSLKVKSTTAKRRPKRRRWSSDLDPMLVGIIICQVLVFTYLIVSTELLLKRNPSKDDSTGQWSFGQILALIVTIPSAFSLIGAMREHGVKRLSRRKKKGMRVREHKNREEDLELAMGC